MACSTGAGCVGAACGALGACVGACEGALGADEGVGRAAGEVCRAGLFFFFFVFGYNRKNCRHSTTEKQFGMMIEQEKTINICSTTYLFLLFHFILEIENSITISKLSINPVQIQYLDTSIV